MICFLSPSLPLSLPLYLFGFSERESIVLRTTKAPLQTFASISRSRDSSNRIVSVFGRKSSPSFATLRVVSSMAYEKELDAAKKAASLAARLCQKVQKALLQSDVQSKSDKSPVTVADYGSQAVVSLVLERELNSEPFSLVAEEDSADLRKDGSQDILERITKLVSRSTQGCKILCMTDKILCSFSVANPSVSPRFLPLYLYLLFNPSVSSRFLHHHISHRFSKNL